MTSADERIEFSIDNTDLPTFLAGCVKAHLFHSAPSGATSWEQLWQHQGYFAR
jgi:hypothetical protein